MFKTSDEIVFFFKFLSAVCFAEYKICLKSTWFYNAKASVCYSLSEAD